MWPTQKAMGQGPVRSQMNLRICFRVRERRDVDLILGQGMLNAGWHAHTLNAPGKFLISSPEHDTPRRARAYLVTDQDVAETAARHATSRPQLDEVSRGALKPASSPRADWNENGTGANQENLEEPSGSDAADPGETLWFALCMAPDEGIGIGELMRITGMSRPALYRYLAQHAQAGRAVQVSWGHWRAATTEEPHGE